VNLYPATQGDDKKSRPLFFDLVAHEQEQAFGHTPGVLPGRVNRFKKDSSIQAELRVYVFAAAGSAPLLLPSHPPPTNPRERLVNRL
jgi:hypothetical protein